MLLCVLTSQSFPPGGQVPPCGGPSAPKTHTLRGLSPPRPLCGPRSPLATVWWPPLPSSPCRGVLPLRLTSPCVLGGGSWFGCSGPNGPQKPGPALSTSVSQKHLESTRPVLPIAFIPGNGRAGRPWEPLPLMYLSSFYPASKPRAICPVAKMPNSLHGHLALFNEQNPELSGVSGRLQRRFAFPGALVVTWGCSPERRGAGEGGSLLPAAGMQLWWRLQEQPLGAMGAEALCCRWSR